MKINEMKRLVKEAKANNAKVNPAEVNLMKDIKMYYTKAYEWLMKVIESLDQKAVEELLEKLFSSVNTEELNFCDVVISNNDKNVAITFRADDDENMSEAIMYVESPTHEFILGETSIHIELDDNAATNIEFLPEMDLRDKEEYFKKVFQDSLVEYDHNGRVVIAMEYFENNS